MSQIPDSMPTSKMLCDASHAEILAELEARYDAVLLCTVARRSDDADEHETDFRGGKACCLGMAEMAKDMMLKHGKRDYE